MRKFLLAGVALVGSVGMASAQTATLPMAPTQGYPESYPGALAGNNAFNSSAAPLVAGPQTPTPGSVVIHLNARVNIYATVEGSSADNYEGNKLQPQQFLEYFRMYPGVDALATNGLRYGGIVEIRQNFAGASLGAGSASAPNGEAFGNSTSGDSSASTLYVRREAIYLGSDTVGIFRIGQDDGPFSQFDNGVTTFQNFNDGAWNGDVPDGIPSSVEPNFPFWSGVGKEYAQTRVTYFSPVYQGFDLGIAYAPNYTSANDAVCSVAGNGCAALENSTTASDLARPTNIFEAMLRYQGTFNGLGVYGIGGYSGSGSVQAGAAGLAPQYNGFSVGDLGLVLTYAGFSVGGNFLFGDYNGQVSLMPKNGVDSKSYIVGAQYATGPLVIGLSYLNQQSQGSASLVNISQRYDDGFAAGLTYTAAPGLNIYVSYLWGEVHQGGYNFLAGEAGSGLNNTVHGQIFSLGARVLW